MSRHKISVNNFQMDLWFYVNVTFNLTKGHSEKKKKKNVPLVSIRSTSHDR